MKIRVGSDQRLHCSNNSKTAAAGERKRKPSDSLGSALTLVRRHCDK